MGSAPVTLAAGEPAAVRALAFPVRSGRAPAEGLGPVAAFAVALAGSVVVAGLPLAPFVAPVEQPPMALSVQEASDFGSLRAGVYLLAWE